MGQTPSTTPHSSHSRYLGRQSVPSSIPNGAQALASPNQQESEGASAAIPTGLSSDKASTAPNLQSSVPAVDEAFNGTDRPTALNGNTSPADRQTKIPVTSKSVSASGEASIAPDVRPDCLPAVDGGASPSRASCSHSYVAASTAIRPSSAADLADSATHQLRGHLRCLHDQLMQQAGADYDIATATTLSYSQFLSYITRLNEICRRYPDADGRVLVFAVKKGSDSSFLWKATVRIACVKYDPATRRTESSRLLTIRQFLQVFRRISYECSDVGSPTSSPRGSSTARQASPASVAFSDASSAPNEGQEASGSSVTECSSGSGTEGAAAELEECIICLERKPDVILPCAHAYCLPCIQQWWEYCAEGLTAPWFCSPLLTSHALEGERTCPVCREAVADADEAWVISEAPDEAQMTREISATLMGLAGGSGGGNCSSGSGTYRSGGK